MREILFRGKRKDNGEWIYWNIYGELCRLSGKRARLAISKTAGEHYYHYIYQIRQSIIPETVGQYTGLTDKNGNKIFEGDLLNGFEYPFLSDNVHNYFAEVVWFDNRPAFGLYTHKHPLSAVRGISEGNCEYMEDFESSQWEVIGNIHDNPELLKDLI